MRCAVTGANGFVGSHLVGRLAAEGHDLRILARETADLRWLRGVPVAVVRGDLDDHDALCETFDGCRRIFHLAGCTAAHRREDFFHVNARGTRAAARACLEAAPAAERFVLVSSLAALGPGRNGRPIDETTSPQPVNNYGRSKLGGEQEARALAPRLPLAIVRPGAIYGPRDPDTLLMLQIAARGFRVQVGLGRRLLNFCHVEDVVSGILLAGSRREALGESFMIGGASNHTMAEVMRTMSEVLGRGRSTPVWLPVSVAYLAGAIGGAVSRLAGARAQLSLDRMQLLVQRNWALDISKARRMLGYEPRYTLAEGLTHMARWCRAQGLIARA